MTFYELIEKINDEQNRIVRERLEFEREARLREMREYQRIHDQLLGKAKFWSSLPETKKASRFIPEKTDVIVEAEYEPA